MIPVYHATRTDLLPAIRNDGLTPRGSRRGNFGTDLASRPEYVYLTRYKALNYAISAQRLHTDRVAILEFALGDLDRKNCYPDEDAIVLSKMVAEGTFEGPTHNARFDELVAGAHPAEHSGDFDRIFGKFGLIAYKGVIPFSLVRRFVVAPVREFQAISDALVSRHPAWNDIAGQNQWGTAVTQFLFDGTAIAGVPERIMRPAEKQRRNFNTRPGPRLA
jgi:hypothetical protein